jgi:ABC-type nickel/cobalt efflux system permease component RcnA
VWDWFTWLREKISSALTDGVSAVLKQLPKLPKNQITASIPHAWQTMLLGVLLFVLVRHAIGMTNETPMFAQAAVFVAVLFCSWALWQSVKGQNDLLSILAQKDVPLGSEKHQQSYFDYKRETARMLGDKDHKTLDLSATPQSPNNAIEIARSSLAGIEAEPTRVENKGREEGNK